MNIIKLFNDFNINYTTFGNNTSKGWISLQCVNPLCNDDTNHLGYNIKSDYFKCWKCGRHSHYKILKWLLPNENTNQLLYKYNDHTIQFAKLKECKDFVRPDTLKLPGKQLTDLHRNYLFNRGFDPDYIVDKYEVLGTVYESDYSYRLIIPVYYQNQLVSFLGRDVTNKAKNRYKICRKKDEVMSLHSVLYNIDNCKKNWVIVTEGPFKVWRLDNNACATCGRNFSIEQVNLLANYDIIYVFFDPDNPGQDAAKKLCSQLDVMNKEVYNIVNNKAPDDMTNKEVENFFKKIN